MLRTIFLSAFLLFLTTQTNVFAEDTHQQISNLKPYSSAAFEAAQKGGSVSLVQFHAEWCPTCRNQKKALEALSQDQQFQKVVFFVADYDNETDLENKWGVSRQSTVIVFKGEKEIARSTSDTSKSSLQKLITQAF